MEPITKHMSLREATQLAASMAWKAYRDRGAYSIKGNKVRNLNTGAVYTVDYDRGRCSCPAQKQVDAINALLLGAGLHPSAVDKHVIMVHNNKNEENARFLAAALEEDDE